MDQFAVIATGGKQYKVAPHEKVRIEKIGVETGASVIFDKVLLRVADGKVSVGEPYIAGASVKGTVRMQGKGDKKIVFRYHSKTRYRKTKGHRQLFTEVEIGSI